MQKQWNINESNPEVQAKLCSSLDIHPIVAQLLINRGITNPECAAQFLSADLSELRDPFLFRDMKRIVKRIEKARDNKEHVLIFGDYDVDGVTSSALLQHLLKDLGLKVTNHIPHRMDDGYGLNHEIGEIAKEKGVDLLITVDCGITAYDEVETVNSHGIEVIIIDHHIADEGRIPNAYAILNPKHPKCKYPFKNFATVGLVAKLIQAVRGEIKQEELDLAALGTIADIVPLVGENRIFVKQGLRNLHKSKNKGIQALLKVAKLEKKVITPFHVGFVLGPRINAAGRMESAHLSLDLFLAETEQAALDAAKVLDKLNSSRQKMQRDVISEAMDIVEQEVNFKDQKVIVLGKEGWHKGVLGIVASKISDKYYRPAVVISLEDGVGTASCRSIEGFHLHEALSTCSEVLEEFGGHSGAAGLTIKEENIDPFRTLINECAQQVLEPQQLAPTVHIDCEISLSTISLDLANIINSMEPFGEGNATPILCSRRVMVKSYPQILGRETLKFWVTDGKLAISAIGFGMASYSGMITPGANIDLAYEIIIDDWNKAPTPQLKLKDIKLSE